MEMKTLLLRKSNKTVSILCRPNTTDEKVIDEVLKKNVYEKPKIDFYVEPTDRWLDLGANIGTFSLLCLTRGASIISYEPEPTNFDLLKTNIENNFTDGFQLVQEAVDVRDGNLPLFVCKGEYNKYRHTLTPVRGRATLNVPVSNIIDVIRIHQPTAIKLDIEGSEILILELLSSNDYRNFNIKKMVFEYSFDKDMSISRFHSIIRRLKEYFDIVYYRNFNETEELYIYHPKMMMVYCLTKKQN